MAPRRFRGQAEPGPSGDARELAPQGAELAVKPAAEPAPYSPEIIARVQDAVRDIPGADGSGGEAIILQLLNATTIDDLNAPWEATNGRSLAGKRLAIRGVTQRESSFNDGTGIFLVVDATDTQTGELATFTTSAISVVLQLARIHQLGMFPVIAEVVVAERPTGRGFYPYHLRIIAAGNASSAAAR